MSDIVETVIILFLDYNPPTESETVALTIIESYFIDDWST